VEEIKNMASRFIKLKKKESISASRIEWLGQKKKDRNVRSNAAGKPRASTLRNSPVGNYMKGNIVSMGNDLCSSTRSESHTSRSASSRPHLESHTVSEAGHDATKHMSMSRQEHEATMGTANPDLITNLASCVMREGDANQYGREPIFAVNFQLLGRRALAALLRGIRDFHHVLGIVAVAVLALSICCYMFLPRTLFFFKV